MSDRGAIVALATPWGRAALALIRASGPDLGPFVSRWLDPLSGPLPDGRARRVRVRGADGSMADDGIAVLRRGPATYTGEDTVEVTIHGNPLLVEAALAGALAAGARLADAGELTRRAVLNGRMDLLSAEGVDQAIRATSLQGLRIARSGLDGDLRRAIDPLREALLDAAAELEARLDYPADELAFESDDDVLRRLADVADRARALAATAEAGRILVDGARVALVGPVNAGKSSLFNALYGRPRALVHATPGTTRDVLELPCAIDGLQVTLLDTAGERETDDPVEAAGLALARELVASADLLLVLVPAGPAIDAVSAEILARTSDRRRIRIWSAADRDPTPGPPGFLATSAMTGSGIPELRSAIRRELVGEAPASDGVRIGSARQRDLLGAVAAACDEAIAALPVAGPAVASEEVIRAIAEIDALTGDDPREAVLDAVFRRFCIGK